MRARKAPVSIASIQRRGQLRSIEGPGGRRKAAVRSFVGVVRRSRANRRRFVGHRKIFSADRSLLSRNLLEQRQELALLGDRQAGKHRRALLDALDEERPDFQTALGQVQISAPSVRGVGTALDQARCL
jgi:hypothetical protein